jgi:hypothetical protein
MIYKYYWYAMESDTYYKRGIISVFRHSKSGVYVGSTPTTPTKQSENKNA